MTIFRYRQDRLARSLRAAFVLCIHFSAVGPLRGDDWPMIAHDSFHSNQTAEQLPVSELRLAWTYRSPQPPQPAWAGPAKWDAYAFVRGLRSMRQYDPVFHTTAVGDRVFFGSSVDDSVHCLHARSGQEQWCFTTDGPVRIAPTIHDGRVYFGSDDGYAYCLQADDGELVWKFQAVPDPKRLINNGRLISPWPVRTGVLVGDGTAYFGASMLPWEPSYLCAVDAMTGRPEGKGRYVRELSGELTLEGSLLASADRLILPQGRIPPQLFDRRDGQPRGTLEGGGGCFVLITKDAQILHGPGNKTGWITESSMQTRAKVASFKGANAMIVADGTAYILTDRSLAAVRRSDGKRLWRTESVYPYAFIMAGNVLFAGGKDEVAAFDADSGEPLWSAPVYGRAFGLSAANGALLVSTDEGATYCFRGDSPPTDTEVVKDDREDADGATNITPRETEEDIKSEVLKLAVEPYLYFDSARTARIRWQTEKPTVTLLRLRGEGKPRLFQDAEPKTHHEISIEIPRHNVVYHYQIGSVVDGRHRLGREYECDTFFNYNSPLVPAESAPYPIAESEDGLAPLAQQILKATGAGQGICLVLGCTDGRLAYELARQSKLRVVAVDTDPARVASIREHLQRARCYGMRVTVHHVESLSSLPFVGEFANLIVSEKEGSLPSTADELIRLLRLAGGVAYLHQPSGMAENVFSDELHEWFSTADAPNAEFVISEDGASARVVRGDLPGVGEWSHQYGAADNSAFGGETLQGVDSTKDLAVQWIGRPGPRAQPDRSGRKPSPLAINGRLFIQGMQRIIGLDSYNGTILWSHEIPALQRFNIPRDSSNWCADNDYVYVAVGRQCWQIDAQTGEMAAQHTVISATRDDRRYDWGYVARVADKLVGSAVKEGTAFTEFWGDENAGWYDARGGPATHKVCSDNLFTIDPSSGSLAWKYEDGVIINSTISGLGNRVYFVECRNGKVKSSPLRRVGMDELWQNQYLVALDVGTGRKIWEKPIDTVNGTVVFYMACGEGKIVLVASANDNFHIYAYDLDSGDPLWTNTEGWADGKGDHGKAMSRPAIVGGQLYVRPRVFDLVTGEKLDIQMQGGACGTYAATSQGLIYRSGNVTFWNRTSGSSSDWSRLRPGCWLSTIPACGMVLSPEAGGGCSCGSWLETSVGFKPMAK